MMIGTDFPNGYLPPNNGANMFDGVKDELLDADLTFGNLEGLAIAEKQQSANRHRLDLAMHFAHLQVMGNTIKMPDSMLFQLQTIILEILAKHVGLRQKKT